MRAGDHFVLRPILVYLLIAGCWLLAGRHTTAGNAAVNPVTSPTAGFTSQSGRTTLSGTYDAGESLRIGTRQIRLLRSQQKVAVIRTPSTEFRRRQRPSRSRPQAGCTAWNGT